MAIEVEERWDGRRQTLSKTSSKEIEYMVYGTDDDDIARDAVRSEAPTQMVVDNQILPLNEVQVTERIAEEVYAVTAKYSAGEYNTNEPEEQTISFDTTGVREKVTQSLGTTSYAAPGVTAPDFGGAIGVTKSGVEGVEVNFPGLTFSIKRKFPPGLINQAYVNTVANLTGKYNNAKFANRDPGEVRFDGATGDQKNLLDSTDVVFKFTVSPNRSNFTVGNIEVESKLGWQYMWVLYEERDDGTFMVQRPIAVYIEDLPGLEPANLSLLGIGG